MENDNNFMRRLARNRHGVDAPRPPKLYDLIDDFALVDTLNENMGLRKTVREAGWYLLEVVEVPQLEIGCPQIPSKNRRN